MPLYSLGNLSPQIEENVFLAPSADIIGDVSIGARASIWFGVVARADINKIIIGEDTNIQDGTIIHVVHALPTIIGRGVTVGHKATLHACTIEDHCLIGMDAVILDGALIREGSVVAAGSVVPPGKEYPANSLIMGSPAKVVRELSEEEKKKYRNHYLNYLEAAENFNKNLKEI